MRPNMSPTRRKSHDILRINDLSFAACLSISTAQGKSAEALPLCERSIVIREKAHGPTDSILAGYLRVKAYILQTSVRMTKTMPELEHAQAAVWHVCQIRALRRPNALRAW